MAAGRGRGFRGLGGVAVLIRDLGRLKGRRGAAENRTPALGLGLAARRADDMGGWRTWITWTMRRFPSGTWRWRR